MPLKSHISQNIFLHIPTQLQPRESENDDKSTNEIRIILFITGNPGLIGYYHEFLARLSRDSTTRGGGETGNVVFGASLGGFEIDDRLENLQHAESDARVERDGDSGINELLFPSRRKKKQGEIYTLKEQIDLCNARLNALLIQLLSSTTTTTTSSSSDAGTRRRKVKVILMGHSVGAFIAMEILRLHNEKTPPPDHAHTGKEERRLRYQQDNELQIEGAILLTPTIINLHLSQSGRIAESLLKWLGIPLSTMAQWGAKLLGIVLGEEGVKWIVSTVTGMKSHEAGLDTTVNFLRSTEGVKQSLELARDELRSIRGDRWGEDVWEETTRLCLLFAKRDRWVADETREEILEKLERGDGRNRVVVDETGLEHAWCLRQNREVADRVRDWLEEIVNDEI